MLSFVAEGSWPTVAGRHSLIVWVTFMTGMTGVIKGWPFAAGMVHSLLPAAPDCLSDLGLKSRVFVWQIMANLSTVSVPLVASPFSVSSWHSPSLSSF